MKKMTIPFMKNDYSEDYTPQIMRTRLADDETVGNIQIKERNSCA